MIGSLHPALLFILGGFLIPFLHKRVKAVYQVALPIFGLINLINIPMGKHWVFNFLDFTIVLGNVDKLSFIFALVFHIAAIITMIYMLSFKDNSELIAAFFYAGSALGAVLSGDLLSFLIFWEMLTIGSMFLILARKTDASRRAAFRYAIFHVIGGLFLLAGIVLHVTNTGSLAFGLMTLSGLASTLIFIGFGINCAWPLLHSWLTDAYPEASIAGTVLLSTFTTKTAVYALARSFPGTEELIWIGAIMAIFTIFYALIENDIRRLLCYAIINQVGFMVIGIGIGSKLAINGAVMHAFNDIIFKGLLFMSVGAVLYRTGKSKITELGGLYKAMPLTAIFCLLGTFYSAPYFSGFVSKSMIMGAAIKGHHDTIWFILLFSAAALFFASLRVPLFTFFSEKTTLDAKEAPKNMLVAMCLAAGLTIGIGSFPEYVFKLLPYKKVYDAYSLDHIISQTQLLSFATLAFVLLFKAGIIKKAATINLDIDLLYRKLFSGIYTCLDKPLNALNEATDNAFRLRLVSKLSAFSSSILFSFSCPFWPE